MAGPPSSPAGKLRYSKQYRLLKHADYQRVYKQGRRHFSPLMTFFYCEREVMRDGQQLVPELPRVGITVGRALGGAVVRNRLKRRMRQAVRAHLSELLRQPMPSVDVVINPKKSLLTAEFDAVDTEVARGFQQIRKQWSGSGVRPHTMERA